MVAVVVAILVALAMVAVLARAWTSAFSRRSHVDRTEREVEVAVQLHSIRRRLDVADVTAQIRADGARARREMDEQAGWSR